MIAEIFIISGFLGAGKTTLIRKLISESFQDSNVVLIENDFGDISVDAALMKDTNIEVRELNSGCICCSISGDFVNSVCDLLEKFHPDKIIIEPSGVAKLSDIYKYCLDSRIRDLAKVKTKITVVDVRRFKKYSDNFGEFFQDQIENADIILLNRTDESIYPIEDILKSINNLNKKAPILSGAWDDIQLDDLIPSSRKHPDYKALSGGRLSKRKHLHNHSAHEVFDTITIRTKRTFTRDELNNFIEEINMRYGENILRVKGILRSAEGNLNLQYVPGSTSITPCHIAGDMLCIIGHGLNRQDIISVFNGDIQ